MIILTQHLVLKYLKVRDIRWGRPNFESGKDTKALDFDLFHYENGTLISFAMFRLIHHDFVDAHQSAMEILEQPEETSQNQCTSWQENNLRYRKTYYSTDIYSTKISLISGMISNHHIQLFFQAR